MAEIAIVNAPKFKEKVRAYQKVILSKVSLYAILPYMRNCRDWVPRKGSYEETWTHWNTCMEFHYTIV
jgi:hypothetical protein